MSPEAEVKIWKVTEFYFQLKKNTTFPTTLKMNKLTDAKKALDEFTSPPSTDALNDAFIDIEAWFTQSPLNYTSTEIAPKARTNNEHNLTMLGKILNLRDVYSTKGRELRRSPTSPKLSGTDYLLTRNKLTYACKELELQLNSDHLDVSHEDNEFNDSFEAFIGSINDASSSKMFLDAAKDVIVFIKDLTKLTGV
jgi:hypothetical protein